MTAIIAMCLFSLSMSISPGPVNLITLSTGLNHGFRRALPFVSGATIGFTLLLGLLGLGLGSIFSTNDIFPTLLAAGGTVFISYLGYRIAVSKPQIDVVSKDIPGFCQGFLLQWLNPKAWSACLAGVSAFNLAHSPSKLATFVTLYFIICYLSIASWALMGEKVKALLETPQKSRMFNLFMGGSLILVAFYLFVMQLFSL